MTTRISNEMGQLIASCAAAENEISGTRRTIAEGLYSEGVRADELGKDGDPELRSEVSFLYYSGLDAHDRSLATADKELAKTFGEADKARRRALQQNKGSFEGAIRRLLKGLQFPDGEADKVTAPTTDKKASEVDKVLTVDVDKIPQEIIHDVLLKLAGKSLELVQEWEEPDVNAVQATLFLTGLIDVLNGNKPAPITAAKLK